MTVLAHGGGAPEAAMIGLPLVLFAVLVLLERRARRRDAPPVVDDPEEPGADAGSSGDGTS